MPKKLRISPRKTPKQSRSKGLVDTIVTAATRILTSEGYEQATTNKVAEKAGVSIGSLYQYFPSKEALIAAVLDRAIERHTRKIEAEIARIKDRSLDEAVRLIVEAAFDLYSGNRGFFRVMFVQAPRLERVQNILRARKHIAKLLTTMLSERGIRPPRPELALFVLINAVVGVLQMAVYDPPAEASRAEIVRELTRLVLGYVKAL